MTWYRAFLLKESETGSSLNALHRSPDHSSIRIRHVLMFSFGIIVSALFEPSKIIWSPPFSIIIIHDADDINVDYEWLAIIVIFSIILPATSKKKRTWPPSQWNQGASRWVPASDHFDFDEKVEHDLYVNLLPEGWCLSRVRKKKESTEQRGSTQWRTWRHRGQRGQACLGEDWAPGSCSFCQLAQTPLAHGPSLSSSSERRWAALSTSLLAACSVLTEEQPMLLSLDASIGHTKIWSHSPQMLLFSSLHRTSAISATLVVDVLINIQ